MKENEAFGSTAVRQFGAQPNILALLSYSRTAELSYRRTLFIIHA